MKRIIRLFVLCGVFIMITCTAACSNTSKGSDHKADAPTDSPTGATEVYIDVTDAPTQPATVADATDASTPSNDASSDKTPAGAADAKSELIGNQWKLTKLYRDGEERQIDVEYGSVIRQTGAYIRFNEDDTFECILGIPGCKGTYAVENGDITLHITTKYGAKTEECDEYATVKWDHTADTLTFDFNNVTNVFTKGS